eukprot:m.55642 g.55642  ORF g.55642 m.55642 type:complete len:588 (-) comp11979_c1_seq1:61-1824(-)
MRRVTAQGSLHAMDSRNNTATRSKTGSSRAWARGSFSGVLKRGSPAAMQWSTIAAAAWPAMAMSCASILDRLQQDHSFNGRREQFGGWSRERGSFFCFLFLCGGAMLTDWFFKMAVGVKTKLAAAISVALAFAFLNVPSATQTLRALREAASQTSPETPQQQRFVVGVNAAVDLIVSATELMRALEMSPSPTPQDHAQLNTPEALRECLTHHMSLGIAGERWMGDIAYFQYVVSVAMKLKSAQFSIGGNAALMSQHLVAKENAKVSLVAAVGPRLRQYLPAGITLPNASLVAQDEVHLILEYAKNEKWGHIQAGRANRFIFSHDDTNAAMRPVDWLSSAACHASEESDTPDTVVVAGMHMLEGQTAAIREQRVEALRDAIAAIPRAAIHAELASIADTTLISLLHRRLLDSVDSIGLNEQELFALSHAANGPHMSITSKPVTVPQIAVVADILHWLLSSLPRLSRIHFHSLTFHIMAVRRGAWSDPVAAASRASIVASERACDTHALNADNVDLPIARSFRLHVPDDTERELSTKRAFDPSDPILTWHRDDYVFVLVPVLVCRSPVKTVGLGDAISAAGLARMHFRP